jgi:hypothetical protein
VTRIRHDGSEELHLVQCHLGHNDLNKLHQLADRWFGGNIGDAASGLLAGAIAEHSRGRAVR